MVIRRGRLCVPPGMSAFGEGSLYSVAVHCCVSPLQYPRFAHWSSSRELDCFVLTRCFKSIHKRYSNGVSNLLVSFSNSESVYRSRSTEEWYPSKSSPADQYADFMMVYVWVVGPCVRVFVVFYVKLLISVICNISSVAYNSMIFIRRVPNSSNNSGRLRWRYTRIHIQL